MISTYADVFQSITGFDPYPYQQKLGELAGTPNVLCNAPTGSGKTKSGLLEGKSFLIAGRRAMNTETYKRLAQRLGTSPLRKVLRTLHKEHPKLKEPDIYTEGDLMIMSFPRPKHPVMFSETLKPEIVHVQWHGMHPLSLFRTVGGCSGNHKEEFWVGDPIPEYILRALRSKAAPTPELIETPKEEGRYVFEGRKSRIPLKKIPGKSSMA